MMHLGVWDFVCTYAGDRQDARDSVFLAPDGSIVSRCSKTPDKEDLVVNHDISLIETEQSTAPL